jgi:glucose/arabinose dehydrogenase
MNTAKVSCALLAACLALVAAPARSGVPDAPIDADEIEAGFELNISRMAAPFEFPSSVSLLPDGAALVTERAGRLWLVRLDAEPVQIDGMPPVLNRDHAGLLDVALDSGFRRNGIIYFSYAHGDGAFSTIRVMRAKLDRSRHCLEDGEVIFESTPASTFEHLGGRMVITDDGYLFLSIGDRQQRELAQDLADHAGSIIRIRTDGAVPLENPFVSVEGARPEIWSYGHRNPQGLALDVSTGRLWAHEHGVKGGDELNLIVSGANYGWPLIAFGVEYSGEPIGEGVEREGLEPPLHHWEPDIAPSGLSVESTGGITTFWIGALVGRSLVRLDMQDERILQEVRLLQGFLGRIRDVRLGPDGSLYLVTDDPEGGLFRIRVARADRTRMP